MRFRPRRLYALRQGVARLAATGVAIALITLAGPAGAVFHKWQINEIYSNSDGTVQFIELFTNDDLQNELSFESIFSDLSTFQFGANLPDSATAFHFVLIGTQSYTQAPGAVAPDYMVTDNFFSVDGDAIIFANVDVVGFGPGDLPVDGDLSIDRNLVPSLNSPINFAFEEGHVLVPEPNRILLQGTGLFSVAMLKLGRRRRSRMRAKTGLAQRLS